jgi:hypothetical protein
MQSGGRTVALLWFKITNMKRKPFSLFATALICVLVIFTACSETVYSVSGKPKTAPPGQVKKIAGSQSAKPFAPGQNKK